MDNNFKPFTTTLIGSLPRSKELLLLKESILKSDKYKEVYDNKLFEETQKVIKMQEECGIDIVVSGELNRDNYMSYVAENVAGVKLLTLQEVLELTNNMENFSKSLKEMDAADNTMNSPICFSKLDTTSRLNSIEIENVKKITNKTFKCTMPSPYLLTRSMWLKEVTSEVYDGRRELGEDVVKLLCNEVKNLVDSGAKIIQIDEPILSEVVFKSSKGDNSFY